MWTSSWFWKIDLIFAVVVIFLSPELSLADTSAPAAKTTFDDVRCKCICPKYKKDEHSPLPYRTVYIKNNADSTKCTCEYVVEDPHVDCSTCECKFQSRNTTTIKVMVIIIVCVISLLLVYMLFLLCLDPLFARRPTQYQEHTDEVVNLDDQSVTQVPQFDAGARPRLGRQTSVINYVSTEQKRWKSTVQEQRKNIYDKHSMLN